MVILKNIFQTIDFEKNQQMTKKHINFPEDRVDSLPASTKFCHLLIIFANSLDPDQAQQDVGPDLDPKLNRIMKKISR